MIMNLPLNNKNVNVKKGHSRRLGKEVGPRLKLPELGFEPFSERKPNSPPGLGLRLRPTFLIDISKINY